MPRQYPRKLLHTSKVDMKIPANNNNVIDNEPTSEFFNDSSENYGTEILNHNLQIDFDLCDEYIEIDGVIVNKAEWEKTNTIKKEVKEEVESNFAETETETSKSAQQDPRVESIGKTQSPLVENTRKWFECDKCNYKTKTKSSLTRHNKHVHASDDPVKWFQCDQCDYKAITKNSLKIHNSLVHTPDDQSKWFVCEQCEYRTRVEDSMKIHTYVHIPANQIEWFQCDQCEYKAETKGSLKTHMNISHSGYEKIKWFICNECQFKTKTESGIKSHFDRKHSPPMLNHAAKWTHIQNVFQCD